MLNILLWLLIITHALAVKYTFALTPTCLTLGTAELKLMNLRLHTRPVRAAHDVRICGKSARQQALCSWTA